MRQPSVIWWALGLLLPLLASCVTSEDFRRVSDSLRTLEIVVADETATVAEVEDQVAQTADDIEDLAREIAERTDAAVEDGLSAVEGLGAGAGGLVSMLLLHLYRDSRRRKRGEPVTPQEAHGGAGNRA